MTNRVEEAIQTADEILDSLDDLPERAEEFADSVRDKTIDIKHSIEERNHCTENQLKSLINMLSGVNRWLS